MYPRIFKIPPIEDGSFFLFGPRGTGKTTWLKSSFPGSVYLDLLDGKFFSVLTAYPERLETFIPPDYHGWVIIDEIQKIPSLLNEVHRLIEATDRCFILTGSSARSLRRKGINLLAGRAMTYYMYPFCTEELGDSFNLSESLRFGLFPAVFSGKEKRKFLESYISTYLREEVLQEGLTRNLAAFSRFLEAASFSQGQVLNITEIARECGVERKTVENYFFILEDMLLSVRIPVFTRRAKRRIAVHPKFYFFDTGVFRFLRPRGPLDSTEEIEGAALETLFLQELRAVNDYYALNYRIHYWRTSSGLEVDFILYGERGLLAIEIKRKSHVSRKDLSGLKAFLSDYPMAKAFLLTGGKLRQYIDTISIIPFSEAILDIRGILENSPRPESEERQL